MSVKETNLTTVTSSDISGQDFVRVLDGQTSRKQTVDSFVETLDPLLVTAGFFKGEAPTTTIEQRFIKAISFNYSVILTDSVILVDTTIGNLNISLPLAATFYDGIEFAGQQVTIKKTSTDNNKIVLLTTGSELIDGNTSVLMMGPELVSLTVISDGINWHIVG